MTPISSPRLLDTTGLLTRMHIVSSGMDTLYGKLELYEHFHETRFTCKVFNTGAEG